MMEGWRIDRLRDILELVYGKSLSMENRKDGNVPVYGSNGIVGFHNEAFVNEQGIIVGRKGSAGNVVFSKVPFCPIDTTFYLTQKNTKLDLEFLFYALGKLDLKRILGDVGVPGLNREMAYLEELTYPIDRNEQRKIAYILNTIQKAIEMQEQLIKTTTELKKALMQKLFTQGLHGEPQKETEIGLVPESWAVTTIGKIADVNSGGTPSRKEQTFWENGNIPWVKTGEVDYCIIKSAEEYITELGLKNSSAKLYPKGTLLMAMYGQGITRGKVAMLGIDATINQACAAIIPKKEADVLSEYLYYFFEHNYDYVRGLSHGANQKNLSGNIIKNIEVSYPKHLTVQKYIILALKTFDNKNIIIAKKKQNLSDLFKTLLHELMTGQRRVNEMEFEGMEKVYEIKEQPVRLAAENKYMQYMNPIFTSNNKNGLDGYYFDDFFKQFDLICKDHLATGRARKFAFIVYDFHSPTHEVLQNQGVFTELNTLSGKDITVFYLNSQSGRDQNHQNQLFQNINNILFELTGNHIRTIPFIVFFDFHNEDVYNLKCYSIRDDELFILNDLTKSISKELKALSKEKIKKDRTIISKLIKETPKIVYTEFIKLVFKGLLERSN